MTVEQFLQLVYRVSIRPEVRTYRLEQANRALVDLKRRPVKGAKVLVMGHKP